MAKIFKEKEFKQKLDLKSLIEAELPTDVTPRSERGVIDRETLEAGSEGKKIIQEAREEAARIRQEAREVLSKLDQETQKSKQEGFDQGHQEGLEQGLEMLIRVKELRQQLFSDNEREMVRLIFEIAKKIVGREFDQNDKAILNVIRLALSDAIGDKIIVRVHPEDYAKIKEHEGELLRSVESGKTIVFREKDDVQAGGCIVETEIGTIDAQLDTQLNAIKKALGL